MSALNPPVTPQSGGVYYIQSIRFPGYVVDRGLGGDPYVLTWPLNRGYNQQWTCIQKPDTTWDIYLVDPEYGDKYYLSVVDGNSGIKEDANIQTFGPSEGPEFRTPWGIVPDSGTSPAFRIVTTQSPQYDIAAVAQSDRARLRNTLTGATPAEALFFTFHAV